MVAGSLVSLSTKSPAYPMHDLLVGYLLGEIDEDERRFVEDRLRRDPRLRKQLAHLARCLGVDAAADRCDGDEPPCDLAKRTSQRVAYAADSGEYHLPARDDFSSLGFAHDRHANDGAHWTVADMTVAAGVVLAIGMLLIPALRDSRCASRRLECANNLRQLSVPLAIYADLNHGFMPLIQRGQNAGMFAVYLANDSTVSIDRDLFASILVCPDSSLASDVASGEAQIRIPTWVELKNAHMTHLQKLRQYMGGSYAYRFPYVENGRFRVIRNTYNPRIPVLADAPDVGNIDYSSCNHGGCGQNVLFQDQSVRYQKGYLSPYGHDHLFLNHQRRPIASPDPRDAVLAPSGALPDVPLVE